MPIQLDDIAKHSLEITKIASAAGLIFGILMYARKAAFQFGIGIWNRFKFQTDMRTMMDKSSKERAEFLARYEADAKKWDESAEQTREINKILRNGISHKLAQQAAQSQLFMESEERPIFMCDEDGKNTVVSLGYLKLLDIHTKDDLSDVQWQSVLGGELRSEYLHAFDIARESHTTFRKACDYRNPYTDNHRGRWKVIAPCVEVNDSLIFTGRFMAVDEKAIAIATEHSWHCCLPKT